MTLFSAETIGHFFHYVVGGFASRDTPVINDRGLSAEMSRPPARGYQIIKLGRDFAS